MIPLIGYQTKWSDLKEHIHTSNTEPIQQVKLYIYAYISIRKEKVQIFEKKWVRGQEKD